MGPKHYHAENSHDFGPLCEFSFLGVSAAHVWSEGRSSGWKWPERTVGTHSLPKWEVMHFIARISSVMGCVCMSLRRSD